MKSFCPKCNHNCDTTLDRKINLQPGLRAYGTFFVLLSGFKDFDKMICPKCKHEYSEQKIKFLGVSDKRFYWVPFFIVTVAVVLFSLIVKK
jgi:predicted nucleic-acid-binding Zn-ribbon protein